MSRSKWKGPYTNIIESFRNKEYFKKHQDNVLTASRNSEIVPKFVGQTFRVYNGKKLHEVPVTEEMLGHKFGEFSFTRARFSFKKKKSKK